jgi:hypothetical protein
VTAGMFDGPGWPDADLRDAALELGLHAPPALVWFDDAGQFHRRCVTDDPNPYCAGCRETATPTGDYYRWEPP